MMTYELLVCFLKGVAVGFVGAVPLGPLGLICIRRTLQSGFIAAVVGGLGTAFADAIFGVISAFGLTFIAQFLKEMETVLRLIGGAFMLGMGMYVLIIKHKPESLQEEGANSISHMGNVMSNFAITLTNPLALVFFTLAFASLGIAENHNVLLGAMVVAGVFCGSMLSWILLSGLISINRKAKILSNMIWINRITGVVLLTCGVWALGGLVLKLHH